MEKKLKKIGMVLVLCLLVLCVVPAYAARTQAASARSGLVKKSGKYYYYKNGDKIKNKWKKVKQNKKYYWFYFGKNGAAYKAPRKDYLSYNVTVKKAGKKKYGFDMKGHRVEKGVYADFNGQVFVFKNKGVYDANATARLRAVLKPFNEGGERGTDVYQKVTAALEKLGEKPLKVTELGNSCFPLNVEHSCVDISVQYTCFEVQFVKDQETGEYGVIGVSAPMKK